MDVHDSCGAVAAGKAPTHLRCSRTLCSFTRWALVSATMCNRVYVMAWQSCNPAILLSTSASNRRGGKMLAATGAIFGPCRSVRRFVRTIWCTRISMLLYFMLYTLCHLTRFYETRTRAESCSRRRLKTSYMITNVPSHLILKWVVWFYSLWRPTKFGRTRSLVVACPTRETGNKS